MNGKDYELLLDINIALSKTQTRKELIRLIFEEVSKVFVFDCPGLFTIDACGEYHTELSDANSVMDPVNRYVYEHMDGNSYPHKNSAIEHWASLKTPKVFNLRDLHENIATHPHFPHMLNAGLVTVMAGALVHEGQSVGTLCLSSKNPKAYNTKDIPRFQAICNQLAIAVSHIQSKDKIQLNDWLHKAQLQIIDAFHSNSSWENKLIQVSKTLRSGIPFDTVTFSMMGDRFKEVNYGVQNVASYEFRAISLESFLNMTQLDLDVFKKYLLVNTSNTPRISNFKKYKKELESQKVKQVINKIFRIQSSLTFMLEVNSEKFYVAFYSKDKNPFQKRHITLFESLQSILIQSLEKSLLFNEVLRLNRLLTEEKRYLKEQVNSRYSISELIGESLPMQQVFEKVNLVKNTDTNILILGETGTGKEVIARVLHEQSLRKEKPLIKVNCASLPKELIESELFGHEKGAFTGALQQRIGKFELANGGTLFLDEIGELPLELQPKLLRAIQEREFERLGGHNTIKVSARIIAATNINLLEAVEEGRFRADLYYRLSVFPITLPPLRDRGQDIELITNHFVKIFSQKFGKEGICLNKSVQQLLNTYDWPGNVRELSNVIERSVLLTDNKYLKLAMSQKTKRTSTTSVFEFKTLQEAETALLLETLAKCNGKVRGKDGAAEKLDIPPSTLEYRMKRAGITRQMVLK
ncbi:sigma 54-interacting transcriptional regulator [Spongiimicrobium salis]|uniref:sigma 54-interacting transcriptional regulator n=1 Tax=Spongiimicrobium salis TaxID=1667022 RepID=UPI00374D1C44